MYAHWELKNNIIDDFKNLILKLVKVTTQKMKFSIMGFFSKCDQSAGKLLTLHVISLP